MYRLPTWYRQVAFVSVCFILGCLSSFLTPQTLSQKIKSFLFPYFFYFSMMEWWPQNKIKFGELICKKKYCFSDTLLKFQKKSLIVSDSFNYYKYGQSKHLRKLQQIIWILSYCTSVNMQFFRECNTSSSLSCLVTSNT